MSFEKGQSGNPNGRPKGAKDKATAELRERVKMILDKHFTPEVIAEDLASMEPKDRLAFLNKLMEYAVPRLKQTDLKADLKSDVFTVVPPNFDRAARMQELKQKLFETDE